MSVARNRTKRLKGHSYYDQLGVAAPIALTADDEYVRRPRPHKRSNDDDDEDNDKWFTSKNVFIGMMLCLFTLLFGVIVIAVLAGEHILPGTTTTTTVAASPYGNTDVTFTSVDITSLSLCVTSGSAYNDTTSVFNFTVVYPSVDVFNLTLFVDEFATNADIPILNITACGPFTTDVFENGVLVGSDPGVARRRLLAVTNITGDLIVQVFAPLTVTPALVALTLSAVKSSAPNITISGLSVITITSR